MNRRRHNRLCCSYLSYFIQAQLDFSFASFFELLFLSSFLVFYQFSHFVNLGICVESIKWVCSDPKRLKTTPVSVLVKLGFLYREKLFTISHIFYKLINYCNLKF